MVHNSMYGRYPLQLEYKEQNCNSAKSRKSPSRQILDSAYVKYIPIGPRKLYAAIFMVVFTILIPVGYLFGKEQICSLITEYKNSKHS